MTDYWKGIESRLHEESMLHYPRNRIRLIFESYINGIFDAFEDDLKDLLYNSFIPTSEAEYLDLRGGELGLERRGGSYATGTVTFTTVDGSGNEVEVSSDFTIPAGTLLQAGEYYYRLLESCIIEEGESNVTGNIRGAKRGDEYNCEIGEIDTIANSSNIINSSSGDFNVLVTNNIEVTGGSDGESDEDYRQRIMNYTTLYLTVNFIKLQQTLLYTSRKLDDNPRLNLTSFNPYLSDTYVAIPSSTATTSFLQNELIHEKIMSIYKKGW